MNTKKPSKQAGSIFANVALGVAAVGSVAAVTADWTAQQAALAVQRQQGQLFTVLNDAVGNYMTLLYTQLTEQTADGTDKIPGTCATLPYRVGESVATHSDILAKKCTLTVPLSSGATGTTTSTTSTTSTTTSTATYTLDNALQPTLSDLKALGILDRNIAETPAMPTELLVSGPNSAGAKSTALAPNGYAISIEPKCVGLGSAASTCNKTNKALISSVINIQPFAQSQYTQNFTTLLWAAGPDAAMSGPADASNIGAQENRINPTGEFRSVQAGWTRNNPITQEWSVTAGTTTTSYTRGADSLMLMRNGYDSAYWQLARRDGSTPPTANWDFNGKDLTNVGKLTAASAEIQNLKVTGDQAIEGNQTVKGNQSIQGDQSVGKNLTVQGTSTFTGLLSAMGGLLVQGATDLRGALTVAGPAIFKDDVSVSKNLAVDGNTALKGTLTGTSATFTGALTAGSLAIGHTQITQDGTLLGGKLGWGVTPGTTCSSNYALAQSTDGKVQICRGGGWTALITSENIVLTAPGAGQACAPEGAPGRLPDGTLVVCKNSKWESTAQGTALEGRACTTEGALATMLTAPDHPNMILLGCRNGLWSQNVFNKPKLAAVTQGGTCPMDDELAMDRRGYPSLLICKSGTWQTLGTQLLANMQKGTSCTLEGVLASDIDHTGLLVCKGGVWAKTTDPVELGSACSPNGREVTLGSGDKLYCVAGAWSDMPPYFAIRRFADSMLVHLNRPIKFNGAIYGVYNEPDLGGQSTSQTYSNISYWMVAGNAVSSYTGRRGSTWWLGDWSGTRTVEIATAQELYAIHDAFGGRPPAWNFPFQDGAEVWTANRRDECDNGCGMGWSGGGGNWWDHITVDIWTNWTFHRYNTEKRPIILKMSINP